MKSLKAASVTVFSRISAFCSAIWVLTASTSAFVALAASKAVNLACDSVSAVLVAANSSATALTLPSIAVFNSVLTASSWVETAASWLAILPVSSVLTLPNSLSSREMSSS